MTDSGDFKCPEMSQLRPDDIGKLPALVSAHVRTCDRCQAVVTLGTAFAAPAPLSDHCDEILSLVALSPLSSLADLDHSRLEAHLAECSGCLAATAELFLSDELRDDDASDSAEGIVDTPDLRRPSRGPFWWGASATTVLVAAAVVLLTIRTGPSSTSVDSRSNGAIAEQTEHPTRDRQGASRPTLAPIGSVPTQPATPARGVGFWRETESIGLSGAKAAHRTPSAFVFDGRHVTIQLPTAAAGTDPRCGRPTPKAALVICLDLPAQWRDDVLEYRVNEEWTSLGRYVAYSYSDADAFLVSSTEATRDVESVATWRFERVVDLADLSPDEQRLVAGFANQHRRYWPPSHRTAKPTSDYIEVIAVLQEFRPQPDCGVFSTSVTMEYGVVKVLQGNYPHQVLYVNHHCPELSRTAAMGALAGDLQSFSAGEHHRMALRKATPKAQSAGPEAIDIYRAPTIPRYWADRTDLYTTGSLSVGNKPLRELQELPWTSPSGEATPLLDNNGESGDASADNSAPTTPPGLPLSVLPKVTFAPVAGRADIARAAEAFVAVNGYTKQPVADLTKLAFESMERTTDRATIARDRHDTLEPHVACVVSSPSGAYALFGYRDSERYPTQARAVLVTDGRVVRMEHQDMRLSVCSNWGTGGGSAWHVP